MVENIEQTEKPSGERGRADFLTIGLGVGLTHLIPAWELLPTPEAVLVAWSFAFAVSYWLPPRPAESYSRWMLERLVLVIAFYLAFFKVPILLKQWMSSMLAYRIPILTFFTLYVLAMIWARRSASKGEPNNSLNPSPRLHGFHAPFLQ